MYRILRNTGRSRSAGANCAIRSTRPRNSWRPGEPTLVLGHHQAEGAGEVGVLLPLRDPGRLLAVRRRLDGGLPGIGHPGPAVDRADSAPARHCAGPTDDPCGSRARDARQVGGLLLADLGVSQTHGRPHVSNDNPFSESQFKTLKYHPEFPDRFGSLPDTEASCSTSSSGTTRCTITVPWGGSRRTMYTTASGDAPRRPRGDPAAGVRGSPGAVRPRGSHAPPLPEAVWINKPRALSEPDRIGDGRRSPASAWRAQRSGAVRSPADPRRGDRILDTCERGGASVGCYSLNWNRECLILVTASGTVPGSGWRSGAPALIATV